LEVVEVGDYLTIASGTGEGQSRIIEDWRGEVIKLTEDWTTEPDSSPFGIAPYVIDNQFDEQVLASQSLPNRNRTIPAGFGLVTAYKGRLVWAAPISYDTLKIGEEGVYLSATAGSKELTVTVPDDKSIDDVAGKWAEGKQIRIGSDSQSYWIDYVDTSNSKIWLLSVYEGSTSIGLRYNIFDDAAKVMFGFNQFSNCEFIHPLYFHYVNRGDGDEITGIVPFQGYLLVAKTRGLYILTGGDFADPLDENAVPLVNFQHRKLPVRVGNVSPKTLVVDQHGSVWGFAGTAGVWSFDGANLRQYSNKRITDFLATLDDTKFSEACGGWDPVDNRYLIGGLSLSDSNDQDIVLWIDPEINSWGVYDKIPMHCFRLLTSG